MSYLSVSSKNVFLRIGYETYGRMLAINVTLDAVINWSDILRKRLDWNRNPFVTLYLEATTKICIYRLANCGEINFCGLRCHGQCCYGESVNCEHPFTSIRTLPITVLLVVIPTGVCLPRGQLCWKGPGGQQAEPEWPVSPVSRGGQERPVLY